MKIAFIVDIFPKLSETFILNQITGLIDRGYEIDILALRKGTDSKIHPVVRKYKLLDRTIYFEDIDRHVPKNKILRILNALYLITLNFHKKPKTIIKSLNVYRLRKHALSLEAFYRVIPFLTKGPYKIIHCHFGPSGNFGLYLRDIGAIDGKIITSFHGYDLTSYLEQKGDHIYNKLFERGDLFLPISDHWKDKLIEMGCGEDKIAVHRMGVDIDKFHFYPSLYAIQTIVKTHEKYGRIKYKIIGDGPLRDFLVKMVDELGANKYIKFLGWKKQDEIIEEMRLSHIFLAPSVTSKDGDQEGIPVVLMEAMAMGLVVISTYHSGIPELIEDGKTGFLSKERDVDELNKKIENVLLYPQKLRKMQELGRSIVEEKFNIIKLNDRLDGIYRDLI